MIVTVTLNPAVDHTVKVQGDLEPGAVTRTGVAQYDAGGKGINVSKYLEAMGTETIATGLVGGLFGQFVERQLDRTKIPHDFVEMDGCTRLNTTVLADDGEYKLNQPGHRVNRETVERVTDKLRHYDPDIAVIAGSLPPGLGPATIDRLAEAGDWDTVVDVRGGMLRRLKVEYAVAAPNREELGVATGRTTDSLECCRLAAESLQGDGIHRVLGSLGPDGAVFATPNGVFSAPATDVEVVDTAGAGDALLAGVLHALDRELTDRTALQYGMAAASRVVGVPGTTVPSLGDLDTALQQVTVREA